MKNSHLAILSEAQALITDPKKWCKGARARDVRGNEVPVMSDKAFSFCAKGAIFRVIGDENADISEIEMLLEKRTPNSLNYVGVNELKGHAEVLEVFTLTILKQQQT